MITNMLLRSAETIERFASELVEENTNALMADAAQFGAAAMMAVDSSAYACHAFLFCSII